MSIGHDTGDITLLGNGGTIHASEKYAAGIPIERVRSLFDFPVAYEPVYVPGPDGGFDEVPNRHAIVRGDTRDVFNVVSKRHAIHDFTEVLLDNVSTLLSTSERDLEIVGAGLLRRGAIGWVQIGTSEENGVTLGGGDMVSPTLTVVSSHDGTFATSYRTGMFRFACSNQLGQLRRAKGAVYKVRHTRNSRLRVLEARQTLEVMFTSSEQYVTLANGLIGRGCDDKQFGEIVEQFSPRPKFTDTTDEVGFERALTRWENKRDDLWDYYRSDQVGEYRGTAWGAFQTLNGYNEHLRPFRSTSDGVQVSRAGRTMQRFIMGRTARDDARALELVLAHT